MSTQQAEANKRIARRVPEDMATEGDIDIVDELYAADAVEHNPFGDHEGRAAIRATFEQVRTAFPDMAAEVTDVVAEGDTVAMRISLRGTHEGPLGDADATGKRFEAENAVFTRIEDGKIAERWVYPEMLSMLDQLGLVDSPLG